MTKQQRIDAILELAKGLDIEDLHEVKEWMLLQSYLQVIDDIFKQSIDKIVLQGAGHNFGVMTVENEL